jgi:hypothetical protein
MATSYNQLIQKQRLVIMYLLMHRLSDIVSSVFVVVLQFQSETDFAYKYIFKDVFFLVFIA